VLLLGAAGGVLYFATKKDSNPVTTTVVTTATVSGSGAPPAPTIEMPSIDLPVPDSGDTAVADASAKPVAGGGGTMNPCTAACGGTITPEIKQAVALRANTAKQCYKSAIQDNEGLAGEMAFSIRVGSTGQACSVSITSDTTGSPKLQQCVKQRLFVNYPAPKGGCADVTGNLSFRSKT
jgi:hypothetical protein